MVGELVLPERCDFDFSKEAGSEELIDSIEDGTRCRFRTCKLPASEFPVEGVSLLFIAHRYSTLTLYLQGISRIYGQ